MGVLFGVGPVDRILGDVPEHALLLAINEPEVEARSVLAHAAGERLATGPVVYLVAGRSAESLREELHALGYDKQESLHIVDAHAGAFGSAEEYVARDPTDLEDVRLLLEEAAEDHPDALICVDSLSHLADNAAPGTFMKSLPGLCNALRGFGAALVGFTQWPYHDTDMRRVLRRFDAVLRLYGVEKGVVRNQALRLESAAWAKGKLNNTPLLYAVNRPGGMVVLAPKIVITGPHDAGKTTLVHQLTKEKPDDEDSAVSTERLGTTVALDRGRFRRKGIQAELFGTPGQRRFDPLIDQLLDQAAAAIVVVDATRPDTMGRAKEMLAKVVARGLHVIVAANKQDLPGALSAEEIAKELGVATMPCQGSDPASAEAILSQLIDETLLEAAA